MTTTTTTTMARVVYVSSPQFSSRWISRLSSPPPTLSPRRFEGSHRRFLSLPVKCLSSEPGENEDSVPDASPSLSSSSSSSSSTTGSLSATSSTYKWCAGLGGVGLLETVYLTYLKLSGSDAFCPVGGGTCGDVLNSDYAVVFGVPLPAIGMVMYGLVTTLGLQLGGTNLPFRISQTYGYSMLLGATTAMASASAYFLYLLGTKLSGASCSYCLVSATLSFSLFFLSLKDVKLKEIQQVVGVQLCLAMIVIGSLAASHSAAHPISSSLGDIELPYFTTEITSSSSPFSLALARHLNSVGAKMYGAFWCSHCLEQKQMFGREAAKLLKYVECFPNGYKKGTKVIKACADAGIEGFPTWLINGQVVSGELELAELAEISGFSIDQGQEPIQLQ